MSCLSEVTNLPLLKIFVYIDFGRGECVLLPTVGAHGVCTGLTGRAVVSSDGSYTSAPI